MPDTTPSGGKSLSIDEVRDLFGELRAIYGTRNGDYQHLRDLYKGEHWDGVELVESPNRYSLVLNYVQATVRGAVRDLLARMPGIQVIPPGTDELSRRLAEAEEGILYGTWDFNDAATVFRRCAWNAVLLRRGLIHMWWDPGAKRVRFANVVPDNFYPLYDGENIAEAVHVSRRLTRQLQRQYPDLADRIRSDGATDYVHAGIYGYSDTSSGVTDAMGTGGRVAQPEVADRQLSGYTTVFDWYDREGNWVRVMGDAEYSAKLNYGLGQVPFYEVAFLPNGDETEPLSEIEVIAVLNQYLDALASQQADIIRKYANPTILDEMSGQGAEQIKRAVSGDGAVLPIRKDGNIRYLNWDGTAPEIAEQYNRILSALYDLSGRPASSYGQTISNQSGVMTNLSLSPVTVSTEDRATLFGEMLTRLNTGILKLYEKFSAGELVEFRGVQPRSRNSETFKVYSASIYGKDIGGWYRNRIKWPSLLRTDDPVFVQNELAKMKGDAENPPAQSVYTTLENLGIEDVEAELDRIRQQLEDPRLHPGRLASALSAATALQGVDLPIDGGGTPADGGSLPEASKAAGNPNTEQLAKY